MPRPHGVGTLEVREHALACFGRIRRSKLEPGIDRDAPPVERDPVMVARLLEDLECLLTPSGARRLIRSADDGPIRPCHERVSARERGGSTERLTEKLPRLVALAGLEQRGGVVGSQREPLLVTARQQVGRTPEERPTGVEVGAIESSPRGGDEMVGRASGEIGERRVGAVELRPVAVRLLEVVPDDLVSFDEIVRREPVGELLVELGARRLRQRLVRRVADEQMAEAVPLVLGKRRGGRADELLAHERRQMRLDVGANKTGRELRYRSTMEHLALDRAALHHDADVAVERVDAGLEERVNRRRDDDLPVTAVLAHHREHLLDVQRVSGRGGRDAVEQVAFELRVSEEISDQRLAFVVAERLEEDRRRVHLAATPVGSDVEELGARDAEQEDRRIAREVGDVLDEVDEDRLGPLQIVDDARPAVAPRPGLRGAA